MALHELDTDLTTLAAVKGYLTEGGNQHDKLIESLIPAASAFISQYCHRKFETASHIHCLDGNDRPEVYAPHWPLTTVTSVHLDRNHEFGSDALLTVEAMGVANASGHYIVGDREEDKGAITYVAGSGRWPVGRRNIKIAYTAGYALVSLPDPVKYAAKRLTAVMYQIATGKRHLRTSESVQPGGGSASWEELTAIAPDIKDALMGFRAHGLGVY
jgi:hypothetical protein